MAAQLTSASIHIDVRANALKTGRATTGSIITNLQFTDGTSVDQADKAYYDERTLAYSSTPDNLDFAGGGLIDLNGDTITWVEMVGLAIENDEDNAVDLVVGAGSNPLNFGSGANSITIKPGEVKVLMGTTANPGYAIAAGSTDNLKIAVASGTNVVYRIWALGRSA